MPEQKEEAEAQKRRIKEEKKTNTHGASKRSMRKKATTEKARRGEYEDEENDEDDHSKEHAHGAKPGIGALELAAAEHCSCGAPSNVSVASVVSLSGKWNPFHSQAAKQSGGKRMLNESVCAA